jgi:hypothetical protein
MSDEFDNLDANEKAALESTLYRCRALAGRIGEKLRKKKPEHFVDERSLADFHASLEHAASVLEQTIHTPTSIAKGLSASPLIERCWVGLINAGLATATAECAVATSREGHR